MINYFYETDFELSDENYITNWIQKVVELHQGSITEINYIFCDDEYLLEINKQYLDHDYYTDIITFDNSIGKKLESDIFISVDRVGDNAKELSIEFKQELHRVIIHGILHLLGYKDKSPEEEKQMLKLEDEALALL